VRCRTRCAARADFTRPAGCGAEALDSALPSVIQHAEVPALKAALRELQEVLTEHGHEGSRVADVRELLSEATRRLLPKASDEPEAAHPR
jgi:hypothetical protein